MQWLVIAASCLCVYAAVRARLAQQERAQRRLLMRIDDTRRHVPRR